MEDVELYAKNHSLQRKDDTDVLNEFGPRLSWSPEGECVLDVGCGPGDVTADIILPLLPPSASLVGVDICSKMVDHANEKYSNNRLKFRHLDFGSKNVPKAFHERSFSKIFSFYCIQLIQDQRQVARNLFFLLRPGGEFIISTCPNHKAFSVYKILSQTEKWNLYMKDIDDIIPRFHFSTSPCDDIEHLLTSEGLEVITCEEREEYVSFPSMNSFREFCEAVNMFVKRVDLDTKHQYMDDLMKAMEDNGMITKTVTNEVLLFHQYIVIHGKRPHNV